MLFGLVSVVASLSDVFSLVLRAPTRETELGFVRFLPLGLHHVSWVLLLLPHRAAPLLSRAGSCPQPSKAPRVWRDRPGCVLTSVCFPPINWHGTMRRDCRSETSPRSAELIASQDQAPKRQLRIFALGSSSGCVYSAFPHERVV